MDGRSFSHFLSPLFVLYFLLGEGGLYPLMSSKVERRISVLWALWKQQREQDLWVKVQCLPSSEGMLLMLPDVWSVYFW